MAYTYDQKRLQAVGEAFKGENPGTNVLSMRDALAVAQGKAGIPEDWSPEQRKLLDLVIQAQKTPLGREMTAKAAEADVWLAVDNNVDGGGYYRNDHKLIALEFADDGKSGDGVKINNRSFVAQASAENNIMLGSLYHELGHFYQAQVWNNLTPPPGIRSADQKLWQLSTESQAVAIEKEGLRQHGLGPRAETTVASFTRFINQDDFHKRYYNVGAGKFDDGVPLNIRTYTDAFGFMPGARGNFLEGKVGSLNELYTRTGLPQPPAHLAGNPEIARLQRGLKEAGLFHGEANGQWSNDLNRGLAKYLADAQKEGLDDGSYKGRFDAIYGPRTAARLEARDGQIENVSLNLVIGRLHKSGELKALYQRPEDYKNITIAPPPAQTQVAAAPAGGAASPATSAAKTVEGLHSTSMLDNVSFNLRKVFSAAASMLGMADPQAPQTQLAVQRRNDQAPGGP